MPVLKAYSKSYEKEGYYVHAPIRGLRHPIPLQTPDITAEIYRSLGYQDGDHIPNELTWLLYDVGLHWTESTGPKHPFTEDDIHDAMREGEGLEFTQDQADEILSIVDSYKGRFEQEVHALIDELNPTATPEPEVGKHPNETGQEHFGRRFHHIDEWYLEDLQLLEEHGCTYSLFGLDGEARTYRVEFQSDEIDAYIEALTAYDEYLEMKDQGYSDAEAIDEINNGEIMERVRIRSGNVVPAWFLGEQLEALLCGQKPDRYHSLPKSRIM